MFFYWPILRIPNRAQTEGRAVNWYSKENNTLCSDIKGDNGVKFKELICTRFIPYNNEDRVGILYDNYRKFSLIPGGLYENSTITSIKFNTNTNYFCYDIKTDYGKIFTDILCTRTDRSYSIRSVSVFDFINRVGQEIKPIYYNSNDIKDSYYAKNELFVLPFISFFFLLGIVMTGLGVWKKMT